MANFRFWASSLTGGGTGALDSIDVTLAALTDGDTAVVITATQKYDYLYDDDNAGTDDSFLIIKPDLSNGGAYSGNARWVLTAYGSIRSTTRIDDGDSPYTALVTDEVVYADTDGGAIEIDLPAGIEGKHYKLINCGSSGNDLTVDPNGTEQLYGAGAGTTSTLADGEIINIDYNSTEGWW